MTPPVSAKRNVADPVREKVGMSTVPVLITAHPAVPPAGQGHRPLVVDRCRPQRPEHRRNPCLAADGPATALRRWPIPPDAAGRPGFGQSRTAGAGPV